MESYEEYREQIAAAREKDAAEVIGGLLALLDDHGEWEDDLDQESRPTGHVTCRFCCGAGWVVRGGAPSKRRPPRHKPDCPRQAAVAAARKWMGLSTGGAG